MSQTYWVLIFILFIGLIFYVVVPMLVRAYHNGPFEPKESIPTEPINIFKDMLGNDPVFSFKDKDKETGIALSSDLKYVALITGRYNKVYPIDHIRGHRISIVEPGQVTPTTLYGRGISGSLQALGHNVGSSISAAVTNAKLKKQAEDETGLFIQVKDIDYPEWHIKMLTSKVQNRWHEILNQLYEGTLSQTIDINKCPKCGTMDIHRGVYIENGSIGDMCSNCKMSLQKMRGEI